MTVVEGPAAPPTPVEPGAIEPRLAALPSLCPYLATPDGTWRSARAVREHRCMAVSPPVPLAPEKQRRLCLVEDHVTCATYAAALAAHAEAPGRLTGHTRPIARMTPVILDHRRFDIRIPAFRADRASQGVLVGLLGLAFAAILLARPSGDAGGVRGIVASPSAPASSVSPTEAPAAQPTDPPADATAPPTEEPPATATPSSSIDPGSIASPVPAASEEPAASGETYRVKSGDTLTAIAARFGTTTQVLIRLNDLVDPSKLKVGQILKLP